MKFFASVLALASAAVVYAQSNPNPFNIPTSGLQTSAGSVVNLTWTPTTQGTVTLSLRYGNAAFLNQSGTIACKSTPPLGPPSGSPSLQTMLTSLVQLVSRTAANTHGTCRPTSFVAPTTPLRSSTTQTRPWSTTHLSSSLTARSSPRAAA